MQITQTITVGSDTLELSSLDADCARLAEPAARDYAERRAIVSEVCGIFSRSQWRSIEPIKAGWTLVDLSEYEGHNYFVDCLGQRKELNQ